MDFQSFVDGMGAMTCVVSVENLGDGKRGKFRIVTGNKAYIDSIENPAPGAELLVQKFIPNSEYTNYLTRDLNFEDYCYKAAVEKKCLHSYATPERMKGIWFNMTFLPVAYEEGNLCYCTYTMEINFEANAERLSNMSADVATSVLETCLKLRSATDFNKTMNEVIKDIGELCGSEHCCILLSNSYERSCSVLCEALSEGTDLISMNAYVDDEFYSIVETWPATISGSNCIIVKDEQDMKILKERNPVWYDSLTAAGVKNIVLFPLKFRENTLGYIWAINYSAENSIKIKETLETTTFILASEIYNYLLLDRLKILSSKDMLTGVMNRNEMNNFVDKLSKEQGAGQSVGVVFTDLNGLKRINDDYGHNAGDTLLKDAAKILEEVFKTEEIFRAGGDEFTIITLGITEDELNSKVAAIKKVAESYDNVSFAIGSCYESDKSNVRLALRLADERMYEDKRLYYKEHPEFERV